MLKRLIQIGTYLVVFVRYGFLCLTQGNSLSNLNDVAQVLLNMDTSRDSSCLLPGITEIWRLPWPSWQVWLWWESNPQLQFASLTSSALGLSYRVAAGRFGCARLWAACRLLIVKLGMQCFSWWRNFSILFLPSLLYCVSLLYVSLYQKPNQYCSEIQIYL